MKLTVAKNGAKEREKEKKGEKMFKVGKEKKSKQKGSTKQLLRDDTDCTCEKGQTEVEGSR